MTSKTFFDDHLNGLQECVKLASDEIMEIYCSENYGQEEKSDGSPLTLADKRSNEIILSALKKISKDISIISDAGTPAISDPAYKLVRAAIKENIAVESIPGPSSFICALTTSGLPTDRFIFEGFLPPKKGRLAILKDLSLFYGTVIFFENPKRLHRTLQDILNTFGERPCVIARELTKMHEEIIRGTITQILNSIDTMTLKGEMVILRR